MGALGWIISIGSGAGLAGFIALLFFAPQMAVAVEKVAVDLFSRIVSTRLGCAALTALVVGIASDFYGDHQGAARVQAEWDAAEHAAIEEGRDARDEAEKAIPPLAAEPEVVAPAEPAPQRFHLPPIFNLSKVPNACPPAPKCVARPAYRNPDPGVRDDPNNRDHH